MVFDHCTGAIDGLSITIRCPSVEESKNQARFFSGRYKKHCMNVQAVCDADCKVIALTVKHCGSTNDASAYVSSNLKHTCETQQYPYHWVGDAAYPQSQHLMVPYTGTKLHPPKDWVNFWHSQVRITIERCFGIFMQRWGIFWKPPRMNLDHGIAVIEACFRLHNFILSEESTHLLTNSSSCESMCPSLTPNETLANEQFQDMDRDQSFANAPNGGNALRERYKEKVRRYNWSHSRSHH